MVLKKLWRGFVWHKLSLVMQRMKPAGLSQHSDTLAAREEEEDEDEAKGEMGKRTEMKKQEKVFSVCVAARSVWTQAVFWQIYYSRPVLNFELCSPFIDENASLP